MVNLPEARLHLGRAQHRDSEVDRHPRYTGAITVMRKAQLRWTDQISRMSDTSIPKQLFYGELSQGRRQVGRPKKPLQIYTVSNSPSKTPPSTHSHGRPPVLAQKQFHTGSSEDSRGNTDRVSRAETPDKESRSHHQQQHIQPLPTSAPPGGEAFSPRLASPCSHLRTRRSNRTNN